MGAAWRQPHYGHLETSAGGDAYWSRHIASTVYTLAFAYAGSALPLIMVAALIDRSVWATILSGEIAEEVVRTLVSSIGLVLAIPATTLIAAFLSVRTADKAGIAERRRCANRKLWR